MFVTHLVCLRCGEEYEFDASAYTCPKCGQGADGSDPGILDVRYDYDLAGRVLARSHRITTERTDLFRYLPLLPVASAGPVLPAGGTPLVEAPLLARGLGLKALYLKDETRNPTRCLKDRATAVGVTMALHAGRAELYCASAGNAAISLAGFCAHLGLKCHVFVPSEVSATRLAWLRRYGADVRISDGDYDRAFEEAETQGVARGWYSRNCAFNPFLVEGKKTVALEIGEQLGWRVPDLVVAPVGDGCTLGAAGKGFRELMEMGLTDRLPRLVGVQSEAIQPLVERYRPGNPGFWPAVRGHLSPAGSAGVSPGREGDRATVGTSGDGRSPTPANSPTRAASVAVRRPRNAIRLLKELDRSNGVMVAATDDEMERAQAQLAEQAGAVVELTSAAALVALRRVAETESLAGKTAVLIITGGRLDNE